MELIKPVQIVTVQKKTPLYKGNDLAERIELINLQELGFDLVAGKDLYQVGDKAVFIQPDYCLSDIPLFESYIRPNGEESKSMLGKIEGKPRRIRAKKFNMSKEPNGEVVYSNGILLPLDEVMEYIRIKNNLSSTDWARDNWNFTEQLNITKYEEPDNSSNVKVGASSSFPVGIYKTDETNIYNQLGRIEFPITLVGSEKIDGSSITIGVKNGEGFICSRNMQKPLFYNKRVGVRNKTFIEKLLFWKKPNLKIYERVANDQDDFVKYGKPYLDKLSPIVDIVFRGELNGSHLKGSGNKNNPARLEKPNIKFFGVDYFDKNEIAYKATNEGFINACNYYDFPVTKQVFKKQFNTFQEIVDECNLYFKTNMIEGIVVRSLDSKFSAKCMNLSYDSMK
jgi:hypothetical protein